MFTGLVETLGEIRAASGTSPRRLTIASGLPAAEIQIGDSVAIDGCCLTVVERADAPQGSQLTFEAATETLEVTTLGRLKVGARVNLERALQLGDRLGGHLVAGHVDGVGTLRDRQQRQSALYLDIEAPAEVARLVAKRGSVTVAGVSLTVTDVQGRRFEVGLIPHTVDATTLGSLAVGDEVNLEADLIARYIERLMQANADPAAVARSPSLTAQFLKDKGFA